MRNYGPKDAFNSEEESKMQARAFKALPKIPEVLRAYPDTQFRTREPEAQKTFGPPPVPCPEFQKWLPSLFETWQTITMEVPAHTAVWIEIMAWGGGDPRNIPSSVGQILRDWYEHQLSKGGKSPWPHD